jgi:PAS domain S-box-containing protein
VPPKQRRRAKPSASEERTQQESIPDDLGKRPGESGDFIYLLFSATNDGFIDWDLRRATVHYSVRWKMLLGYENDDLPAGPDTWKTLTHPDDLAAVESALSDSLENLWPFSHKWRMRHRSGEWRWFLCRAAISRDLDATPQRIVLVFTDITDWVHAEERYRVLAEGVPDAILRVRRHGTILDEKPATRPMPLLTPGEGGTLIARAVDPDWARATLDAISSALHNGTVVTFEHGDGVERPCLETRVVKTAEHEAVCIVRDISDRKQGDRRPLGRDRDRGRGELEARALSGHRRP